MKNAMKEMERELRKLLGRELVELKGLEGAERALALFRLNLEVFRLRYGGAVPAPAN